MNLNWNFQRGGGLKPKKPSVGGQSMGIFWNNSFCRCSNFSSEHIDKSEEHGFM